MLCNPLLSFYLLPNRHPQVLVQKIIADEAAGPWAKLKPGEICEEMQLGDAVGMVIGRQGTMIRTIKDDSGADLDISREGSGEGSSLCRVFGKPECVEKAKAAIAEILERHTQMKERRAKYEKEQAAKKAAKEGEGEGDGDEEDEAEAEGEGDATPAKAAESAPAVSEPATDAKEAGGWDADPSADMGVGTNGW